jgi:hypothetical protein
MKLKQNTMKRDGKHHKNKANPSKNSNYNAIIVYKKK